ncbi:hypothetical protein Terro_3359 [Terriglobus roseus DSM 18391]|uniref:Uncharacterized protein n=1 Tax=Terriglobus roseus (strain DSM 18391 / NRRL B-41598 / KBS 63) TaxID=926566 RepID=I3ZK08_TERRK|nr:hypothetical protein Terro_3359 [Terriglobus roseus DSM 18391]
MPLEASPGSGLRRTRLYLRDGSFQVVLSYSVKGENVFYLSAERGAEQEIIPVKLVDLDKTREWERRGEAQRNGTPAVQIDPELAKEEADRAARSPEVAKDLRLPDESSVLMLDTYQGQPQLAVLQQTDGELNRQQAHNILRQTINPMAHAHQLVEIKGQTAPVQLHVADPEIYVRMDDDDAEPTRGGAFQVDTDGNRGRKVESPSPKSEYVIVRVDVRRDVRIVTSFSIGLLGGAKRQADVVETTRTLMPGGHWLKIVPKEPLSFGEYALMEVIDAKTVNTGVWDFGVRPSAGPNRDAILPEVRHAPKLAPRRSQP